MVYGVTTSASEAEARAARWLARGNDAKEQGKDALAERHYARAQAWLDLANRLRGNGDGA